MFREQKRYGRNPSIVVKAADGTAPLKWKEPATVFTCSWSDFFIEDADEWRTDAWDIIRKTPHLTYLILTKRLENVLGRVPYDWPLPNVWLGTSIEDQATADERIPRLLQIPAAVRFVSAEPLLGPIGLRHDWLEPEAFTMDPIMLIGECLPEQPRIDWVIVGGESGPNARPMHPDWARSLRDQCQAASIPFFFKQFGTWKEIQFDKRGKGDILLSPTNGIIDRLPDPFNGNAGEFKRTVAMRPVGKKAAGRLLDGREWNERP